MPFWRGAQNDARCVIRDEDQARFRTVVLPHLDDCYRLARWLTGNRADAEDVVQEACLDAFRGITGFNGSHPRAWVLTIVRHAAYRWLRKNRPAALVVVDDLEALDVADTQIAGSVQTPEAALIAQADTARLEQAIAALPVPFRETLVLRDVNGLDYRDIADITGVPIGTVMSRLARARRRLITTLRPNDP
jgi:RNA polymerase sigma-70 factor (ECF subfamily)